MDQLAKKTLTTKRGFTYTYYVSPAKSGKPTLFLHHGFPDEAAEWEGLIRDHLVPNGYGVIAPDMLGYGGSSKPTDPEAYKWHDMTADQVEIISAEKVNKVVSLGHDWGSRSAQMLYNVYPEHVEGLAMVNVAYSAPTGQPFDLDSALHMTEQIFGYGTFWYWKLFCAPDGAALMNKHVDILFNLLHTEGKYWLETMCKPDGVRQLLEEGRKVPMKPYATEAMRKHFVDRMTRDGFDAPVCWYKSHVFGQQDNQGNKDNAVVKVPTLFLGYDDDVVCRHEMIKPSVGAGLLPHLEMEVLEGSHWGLLERPDIFGSKVVNWLDRNFPSSKL